MNYKKREKEILEEQRIKSLMEVDSRARSVTVGTAFGGVTEIIMRRNDGSMTWCILQPVEVVELIHQLSANIGCHISIRPRNDFSSWRGWNTDNGQETGLLSKSNFSNDKELLSNESTSNEPNLKIENLITEGNKDETVATKKTVNRRKSKPASGTT
ncbi:MAG: hypothetical protein EB127_19030 [Alphaproteobacteria bacterium]|nr:hypothetical protein [Alphaproteobacteria bacterium]